jgi:hypothetical protein
LRGIDYNLFFEKKISPPFKVFLTAYNFDPEYTLPSLDFGPIKKECQLSFSFHEIQSSQQYYEKCSSNFHNSINDNKSIESLPLQLTKQETKLEKFMNKRGTRNAVNVLKTACSVFNASSGNQCNRKAKQNYYRKELIYSNSGALSHSASKSKLNEYPTLTPLFVTNIELAEPREIILPNTNRTTPNRKDKTPKYNPMSRILEPLKTRKKFDCSKCGKLNKNNILNSGMKKQHNDGFVKQNSSKQCHSSPDVNDSITKIFLASETNIPKECVSTPNQVIKPSKNIKTKMVSIDLKVTRNRMKN